MITPPALPFLHPATLIATWFGSGLLPKAPGTWGSLAALPVGLLLVWQAGPAGLLAGTLLVFLLGLWAAGRYCAGSGQADPAEVVVDEVAGQWLALLPAGLDPLLVAVAFVAFRAFDIFKPWPVGLSRRGAM